MSELKVISADELEQKMKNKEELELIDVRENDEVAEGMIPGAKHIPMGNIPMHLDQLSTDKEYIIVCRAGRRSENVCYFLQDHGYKVVNMEGGMLDWKGETI
ncbi:rhodanese-like domain-containing protein [Bacillus sp. B1-b2]|uniref:rhodanese-like domain-containing protein n=1 Tax=Bacillus sp. B1-b2 TaxID=2653201 RepID=UPI0012621D89|nr:rhodanese-like domain-containing protein [Bacillus sp. B1-b2]KAB7666798.1 rhodanese-like domain-containing protein [Bacillus sp. B1-b2]